MWLQDLDVDFRLQLKHVYHDQLMRQIQADAALLERMHVMDYSLLLGIHYVEWGSSWYPPHSEVLRVNLLPTASHTGVCVVLVGDVWPPDAWQRLAHLSARRCSSSAAVKVVERAPKQGLCT